MDKRTEAMLKDTSVKELLDDIKKTVGWVKEDGYGDRITALEAAVEGMDEANVDTARLREAVDACYGEPDSYGCRRVLPECGRIAGYLQSVCGNIRYIEYKLGIRK